MTTLTNPIRAQNIVDRFEDYVTAAANSGISWTTSSRPTWTYPAYSSNVPPAPVIPGGTWTIDPGYYGGAGGLNIAIAGASLGGPKITASSIVSVLRNETARYSVIRNQRVVLTVTQTGGKQPGSNKPWDELGRNQGSIGPGGVVFDQTAVAHMAAGYAVAVAAPATTLTANTAISATNLETFFANLRTAYNSARSDTAYTPITICHSSCHASCHSSRNRR